LNDCLRLAYQEEQLGIGEPNPLWSAALEEATPGDAAVAAAADRLHVGDIDGASTILRDGAPDASGWTAERALALFGISFLEESAAKAVQDRLWAMSFWQRRGDKLPPLSIVYYERLRLQRGPIQ
jgi:hypothetical protein